MFPKSSKPQGFWFPLNAFITNELLSSASSKWAANIRHYNLRTASSPNKFFQNIDERFWWGIRYQVWSNTSGTGTSMNNSITFQQVIFINTVFVKHIFVIQCSTVVYTTDSCSIGLPEYYLIVPLEFVERIFLVN